MTRFDLAFAKPSNWKRSLAKVVTPQEFYEFLRFSPTAYMWVVIKRCATSQTNYRFCSLASLDFLLAANASLVGVSEFAATNSILHLGLLADL